MTKVIGVDRSAHSLSAAQPTQRLKGLVARVLATLAVCTAALSEFETSNALQVTRIAPRIGLVQVATPNDVKPSSPPDFFVPACTADLKNIICTGQSTEKHECEGLPHEGHRRAPAASRREGPRVEVC